MSAIESVATESDAPATLLTKVRRAGSKQLLTMSGQLLAGVGNMIISALFARVLLPGEYAILVSFLSAYVLMHMVGSSVTAAVAIQPDLHRKLFWRGLGLGLGVGAVLAALSGVLSPLLNLPVPVIMLLGSAGPSAILLALARGRLYGIQSVRGTIANLVTEPIGRAMIGLVLGSFIGPVGAAIGVVSAGYAALAAATVAARMGPKIPSAVSVPGTGRRTTGNRGSVYVTLTFLLVACLASANAIFSNRQLDPGQAGIFAAVATIGSAAYFATGTIPMMLSGSRDSGHSTLLVAIAVAAAVSIGGIGVVWVLPSKVYEIVLGPHYASVGDFVVAYVAAMGALGIGRVLIAQLCKTGLAGVAAILSGIAVAVQIAVLIPAHSASAVVAATAAGCSVLMVGSAAVLAWETFRTRARTAAEAQLDAAITRRGSWRLDWRVDWRVDRQGLADNLKRLWPLWIALGIGIGLRVVVTRSIWVDEAISIQQAQLPYPDMIYTLKNDDVHPPLYHTTLWVLVHLTGSVAEYIVRLPSLLAGTACIPISYAMAQDIWNRRTAIITGFVVAFAPVAVWYSQEARMYGIWMLGATILAWCQLRILRDIREGKGFGTLADWAGFSVVTAGMIYVQWFTALPIITQHLIFLIAAMRIRKARFVRNWLLSIGVQLLLFAPLVPYMVGQFSNIIAAQGAATAPEQTGSDTATTGHPGVYDAIANLIWSVWGYHADSTMVQLGAFWPLAVLICFAALGRVRDVNNLMILAIGVLPPTILFVIGFERRQFFELRYFDSTVPMLLMVLARATATWGRGPLTRLLLPIVTVASLGAGLVDQQVNQSNPRVYDFRGAVAWVKANSQPQDVVLYAPNFLNHELEYYPSGLTTLDANSAHPNRQQTGMPAIPPQGRRVFVFGSFLEEPQVAGQVGSVLSDLEQSQNTEQVAVHSLANVRVWEFKQLPPTKPGQNSPQDSAQPPSAQNSDHETKGEN